MKRQSNRRFSRKRQVGKGSSIRSQARSSSKMSVRLKPFRSKSVSIRSHLKSTRRQSTRSPSKSNRSLSRSRHIQFNTPENKILEYSLGESEKEWKQKSIDSDIPKCKKPKRSSDFPCRQKNTIFQTKKQYDSWQDLKHDRNASTGYKSRSEHYDDIDSILLSRGDEALLRK